MGNAASTKASNNSKQGGNGSTEVVKIGGTGTAAATGAPLTVANYPPPTASPFQAAAGPGRGPQAGTRGIVAGARNTSISVQQQPPGVVSSISDTEDEVARFVREAIKTTHGPHAVEESAALKYSKGFDKDKFKMANHANQPTQQSNQTPKSDDNQDLDFSATSLSGRPKTRASAATSSGVTVSVGRSGSGMPQKGTRYLDEDDEDLMEEILSQTDPSSDYGIPSNRGDSAMRIQRQQWVAVE